MVEAESRVQALEFLDLLCASTDFMEVRLLPALRARTITADDVELSDVTEGRDTDMPTVARAYLIHYSTIVRSCQDSSNDPEAER